MAEESKSGKPVSKTTTKKFAFIAGGAVILGLAGYFSYKSMWITIGSLAVGAGLGYLVSNKVNK